MFDDHFNIKTCGLFTDTCVRINRIGQFSSARSVKEPIRKEHELFMRTRKVKWVDSRSVSVCKIVRGFPAILNRFSKSSYCLKLDPLSLTYKNQYPPPPPGNLTPWLHIFPLDGFRRDLRLISVSLFCYMHCTWIMYFIDPRA